MTRFDRPVQAAVLFNSAEMRLRSPHESQVAVEHRGVDEGVGTGFDDLDPSAVAERVVVVTGAFDDLMTWYAARLAPLGWHARETREDVCLFVRDEDEMIEVQLLPAQDWWAGHYRRPGPFARVVLMVKGYWPDGDG